MNYYVYVLQSLSFDHYYIGQTNNIVQRLELHNAGKVESSRRYKPWKMHYFETFNNRIDSLKREKYFKSHASRNWLKKHLGL